MIECLLVINFYVIFFCCFADKAPSEAVFHGAEYLSYDLTKKGGEPIVSAQDSVTFYFKTRQPNGLLFYTGTGKTRIIHFSLFTIDHSCSTKFRTLNNIAIQKYCFFTFCTVSTESGTLVTHGRD